MKELTPKEGEYLVRLARGVLERKLLGKELKLGKPPEVLGEPFGVFVTLKTHPDGRLRGCIGFPEPVMALLDGVAQAALAAALRDPRFPPVQGEELGQLVVEVSVLTPPEPMPAKDPGLIKIGKHGLLVRDVAGHSGLLLPQVAVEESWGPEEFLDATCLKAGLPRGAWREPDVEVFWFGGQVFAEREPGGEVIRVM